MSPFVAAGAPRAARAARAARGGEGVEQFSLATSPRALSASAFLDYAQQRSLSEVAVGPFLEGENVVVGKRWRCAPREPCNTPGAVEELTLDAKASDLETSLRVSISKDDAPYSHCIEQERHVGLKVQVDIDLACTNQNFTCAQLETVDWLRTYKEDLYKYCDNDDSLVNAQCTLVCRFGTHATKRCYHEFDRDGKFGIRSLEDGEPPAYNQCVIASWCEVNATSNTTHEAQLVPQPPTSAAEADGSTKDVVIIVVSVIAAFALLLVAVLCCFLLVRHRKTQNSSSTAVTTGGNMVIGMPVAAGESGGDAKGYGLPLEVGKVIG